MDKTWLEKLNKLGPAGYQVHCTQVCCHNFNNCKFKFKWAAKYNFWFHSRSADTYLRAASMIILCSHDTKSRRWSWVSEWMSQYWGTVFTFLCTGSVCKVIYKWQVQHKSHVCNRFSFVFLLLFFFSKDYLNFIECCICSECWTR